MTAETGRTHQARRRAWTIGALAAMIVGMGVAISLIGGSNTRAAGDTPTPPPAANAQGRTWDAVVHTSVGEIDLSLDGASAPQAVASFIHLAEEGFFDGTECHRLLPDSLLQCGDPSGRGTGGPGYQFGPIENAPADDLYPAGAVAMARVSGDGESMGSQFFLVFDDVVLPSDDAGGYSVMGEATSGLELWHDIGEAGTVDGSMDGRPLTRVIIESVEVK